MADVTESGGWVKIHRCLLDSEIIQDGTALAVFMFCVLRANNKPKTWRGIQIPRGSLVTSGAVGCEVLKLSPNTWRSALARLVALGMVETWTASRKHTRIKLVNYEKWQSGVDAGSSKSDKPIDEPKIGSSKTEQPIDEPIDESSEQPADNKQEVQKVRMKEDTPAATPPGDSSDRPAKPKAKPPAFDPLAVPIPQSLDTPLFRKAWAAWAAHRVEIKARLTEQSTRQQIRLLVELGHDKAVETIRTSIRQSWRGLFPEPAKKQSDRPNGMPSVIPGMEKHLPTNQRRLIGE
jgi:hypothetical protein